jgi:hypothetical protein
MNHLSHYVTKRTRGLYKKYGAFFSFGADQFEKQRKEGVTYLSMGSGLVCPKDNCKALHAEMNESFALAVEDDKADNDKQAIIRRELYNYECFYVGDIADAVSAVKSYGYSYDDVLKVYRTEYATAMEAM